VPEPTGTWYIGFDISTSLGWDLRNPAGKSVAGGVLKLATGLGGAVHEENLRRIGRVISAAHNVAGAVGGADLEPALEDVEFTKFAKASASYWRVRTLVELAVYQKLGAKAIVLVIGTSALKTHAMGGKGQGEGKKGQVTKRQMVEACAKRDGTDFPPWELTPSGQPTAKSKRSGDRADAAHVSHWAWETDSP